ncbi:TauD/TfdA family dioxygenase [Aquimarina algiphila]|uniref:TauD/TfdA family dioxygenase n=1 Tax=Aquimarina algiphila TaxID=2047982 RepID=UPI002493444F|nr:TauD/TfdA family dioxygenase [Aquimarina algiphila]
MNDFYNVPVFNAQLSKENNEYIHIYSYPEINISEIKDSIEQNKLVLIRSMPFDNSSSIFGELVDEYGLRSSYDIQMQLVPHMIDYRKPIDEVAVTVNERGPFQIIQPHSEGYSGSPLELFGLHCTQNSITGGENILSLINQKADYSKLLAKEKVIIGKDLSAKDINTLRRGHLDAKEILPSCNSVCRVLKETQQGSVVVKTAPVKAMKSPISGETLFTYWDNITVHDHAFHRHQYEILCHLGILNEADGLSYEDYIHIEGESYCAPIDTDSGDVEQTAKLFDSHVVYKMQPNDFMLLNNRVWTHSVNNWPPDQVRKMSAMYA